LACHAASGKLTRPLVALALPLDACNK
jgi:hypothetical protein